MDVDKVVEKVFGLFEGHGTMDYIGEMVSITDHCIQCALLAEKDGYSTDVVMAALLHDIGHLVGIDQGATEMTTEGVRLGAQDHDVLGGQFLRGLGFPDKICDLVQSHVQAKRYLVWKHPQYYNDLSSASKMTLEHQGGRMTTEEAVVFEKNPHFGIIIRMRNWDEAGKNVDVSATSIDRYREMCREYLSGIQRSE